MTEFAPFVIGSHFEPSLIQQLEAGVTLPVAIKNVTVKDRPGFPRGLLIGAECYAEPLRNARVGAYSGDNVCIWLLGCSGCLKG